MGGSDAPEFDDVLDSEPMKPSCAQRARSIGPRAFCIVFLHCGLWLGASASFAASSKPNVVFILADDLGVNDLSLYGSKFHETPNIDALARRGMMFTHADSARQLATRLDQLLADSAAVIPTANPAYAADTPSRKAKSGGPKKK